MSKLEATFENPAIAVGSCPCQVISVNQQEALKCHPQAFFPVVGPTMVSTKTHVNSKGLGHKVNILRIYAAWSIINGKLHFWFIIAHFSRINMLLTYETRNMHVFQRVYCW